MHQAEALVDPANLFNRRVLEYFFHLYTNIKCREKLQFFSTIVEGSGDPGAGKHAEEKASDYYIQASKERVKQNNFKVS
jgi:hypothetical protein